MIRLYHAKELREALSLARAELGNQAPILYQRELNPAGWGPFKRCRWEVAALDDAGDGLLNPWGGSEDSILQLQAQIVELRNSVLQLNNSATLLRLPQMTRELVDVYEWLCRRGVSAELAQHVVMACNDELTATAQNDPSLVRTTVSKHLEGALNIRLPRVVHGNGPLVVFLIGQAGAGKTTTLLKLAARQALKDRHGVVIINADTVRLASGSQFDALTQTLDVAVDLAAGPDDLRRCLEQYQETDVLFVDTPACNYREARELQQLAALVKCAPRRQTFLVMAGSTSLDEMHAILHGFQPVGLDGIILSRLDEIGYPGRLLSFACQSTVPLAYLTAGRRIPEDIEAASPQSLVALLASREIPVAAHAAAHAAAPETAQKGRSRRQRKPAGSALATFTNAVLVHEGVER